MKKKLLALALSLFVMGGAGAASVSAKEVKDIEPGQNILYSSDDGDPIGPFSMLCSSDDGDPIGPF